MNTINVLPFNDTLGSGDINTLPLRLQEALEVIKMAAEMLWGIPLYGDPDITARAAWGTARIAVNELLYAISILEEGEQWPVREQPNT